MFERSVGKKPVPYIASSRTSTGGSTGVKPASTRWSMPRGVLTEDGRPAVWLDTTRIKPEDAEISLPYMLRRYRGAGIDPLSEPIYTFPVLHYQNGGLVIDEHAETTLEGVFACGEIAGGTHGRNRMMGNSLLECVVFGRRAGKAAAERARS